MYISQYKQTLAPFKADPSTVFILEDEQHTHYYCFAVHANLKSFIEDEIKLLSKEENKQQLRKFLKAQEQSKDVTLFFFEHIEGQTVYQMIANMKMNQKSIKFETIKKFFLQLIDALYLLHKNKILGRVFTTENIIAEGDNLLLMDFGYGSDILLLSKNMINPQELSRDKKSEQYTLALDVWLLGAFLFNLVKLRPINLSDENILCKSSARESDKSKSQQQIIVKSSCDPRRYDDEFTCLIESMLIIEQSQRITFKEILEDQFCEKNMDPKKREEYLKFYTDLESKLPDWFEASIKKREEISIANDSEFLLRTAEDLKNQHHLINELYLGYRGLPAESTVQSNAATNPSQNSSRYQIDNYGNILESMILVNEGLVASQSSKVMSVNSTFKDLIGYYDPQRTGEIWKRIYMQFYLVYLIRSFAERVEIQEVFDNTLYKFFFNKLRYLILVAIELNAKGKENYSSDPLYNQTQWKNFLQVADLSELFGSLAKLRKEILQEGEEARQEIITNRTYKNYQEIKIAFEQECMKAIDKEHRSFIQYLRETIRPITDYCYQKIIGLQKKTNESRYCYSALILTLIHTLNRSFEFDFLINMQTSLKQSPNQIDFTDPEILHSYLTSTERTDAQFGELIHYINEKSFKSQN